MKTRTERIAFMAVSQALWDGMPDLCEAIRDRYGIRDGSGYSIPGDLTVSATVGPVTVRLKVRHLDSVGDVSWVTFRACALALASVAREHFKHTADIDGRSRYLATADRAHADIAIGPSRMILECTITPEGKTQ